MKPRLRSALQWTGCVLLTAWLAFIIVMAARENGEARCRGLRIAVVEGDGESGTTLGENNGGFVTAREIARELGDLPRRATGMRMADIDTRKIRRHLEAIDKIEDVEVVKTTDGFISIVVRPLEPVARIFDGDISYYINKDGKRITANPRYFVDVPIIQGHFLPSDSVMTPLSLLPMLQWIKSHSPWNELITMVQVRPNHDIILVPAINGHVINIGNAEALDSKMEHVLRMYRRVMPVRGWDFYDTISVKWAGQVVATRRVKAAPEALIAYDEEEEQTAVTTMLTDEGVAPGQTRPGVSAHSEKPIPGARNAAEPKPQETTNPQ